MARSDLRVRGRVAGAATAALVLLAACSAGGGGKPAPTGSRPRIDGYLGFDRTAAVDHDTQGFGGYPTADPMLSCGSDTQTYAADLVTAGPAKANVRNEWGEVRKGLQAYASGFVSNLHFGTGDLPFTHPFGSDMTFDMVLDQPFAGLAQTVGTGLGGTPPGAIHTEIAEGLIPHGADGDYLGGFTPSDGDRTAAYGAWVIDCGHDDFHTEIHPPSVFAFAHQDGGTTVSNAYANPYVVTQLFNPDPSVAADFGDPNRLTAPTTLIFPKYVVNLILGMLGQGPEEFRGINRLETHTLIDADSSVQDVTWFVCTPDERPSGGALSIDSNFTTRSGVDLSVKPREDLGCAEVTATVTPSYAPLPLERKDCVLDWEVINKQARLALMDPDLDIRTAIKDLVPASIAKKVERSPAVDCYDPLTAPALGSSGKTVVDDSQPYPFYGRVAVSWR